MACAKEIAASTAQLVVSSKVKAERGSVKLTELSAASKTVNQATGKVVASAKSAAEVVEDQSELYFLVNFLFTFSYVVVVIRKLTLF